MSVRHYIVVLLILAALAPAGAAIAAVSEDRLLPLDQYTSEKGRRLGATHEKALRNLNAGIYHCMPWVETQKNSIGFFRPKLSTQDDRYLSVRIYIEQDPSPTFESMRIEERASAMFSRYVGALLRRMTADPAVLNDPAVDGFTVILEWLKQAPKNPGDRPVHETIAVFLAKPGAADYLAGRIPVGELASRARILGFDGETALGPLKVTAWDDDFVATYKVANYQPEPGAKCG